MAKEQRETVSYEDLIYSNMIQIEAVTRLLVNKGLISKEELLEEVRVLNAKHHKKAQRIRMPPIIN